MSLSFTNPFLVGGADRDAVFYTPHEEGRCRLWDRGSTPVSFRIFYSLPPRGRVHRDTKRSAGGGVVS